MLQRKSITHLYKNIITQNIRSKIVSKSILYYTFDNHTLTIKTRENENNVQYFSNTTKHNEKTRL